MEIFILKLITYYILIISNLILSNISLFQKLILFKIILNITFILLSKYNLYIDLVK